MAQPMPTSTQARAAGRSRARLAKPKGSAPKRNQPFLGPKFVGCLAEWCASHAREWQSSAAPGAERSGVGDHSPQSDTIQARHNSSQVGYCRGGGPLGIIANLCVFKSNTYTLLLAGSPGSNRAVCPDRCDGQNSKSRLGWPRRSLLKGPPKVGGEGRLPASGRQGRLGWSDQAGRYSSSSASAS